MFATGTTLAITAGIFQSLNTMALRRLNDPRLNPYGHQMLSEAHQSYICALVSAVLSFFLAVIMCPELFKIKTLFQPGDHQYPIQGQGQLICYILLAFFAYLVS